MNEDKVPEKTTLTLDEKKQEFIQFVKAITNENFFDYISTYTYLADSIWN